MANALGMNGRDGDTAAIVAAFYERLPYPPPVDDLEAYGRSWNDGRRRGESHLLWPNEPFRDDRSILVVGCGTVQAAHYAARYPRAKVVGIDVSAASLAFSQELKRKHGLHNLEFRELAVERAGELGAAFDHVVCTGVLHHLVDPVAGLLALRSVVAPSGGLHLMVYAPYGRAGIYLIQEYCRRIGVGTSDAEIRDLAATMKALPPNHPLAPLLRASPDFVDRAGLADALLHPKDRAYSVQQLLELLTEGGFTFGRWVRQAPYLATCGALGHTPHTARLAALPAAEQYAAIELFRGTMSRHAVVAYPSTSPNPQDSVRFDGDAWPRFVPIRAHDTVIVRERLPAGAAAVLINRGHTFTDLYLPVDAQQAQMVERIDGARTVDQIATGIIERDAVRRFFETLWRWDQVVFDVSKASAA